MRGIVVEVVRKDIRNLHLGVYPPAYRVRVAAPLVVSDEAVRLAVIDKLGWIKRQRARFAAQPRQSAREMVNGESHYFLGKRYRLRVHEQRRLVEGDEVRQPRQPQLHHPGARRVRTGPHDDGKRVLAREPERLGDLARAEREDLDAPAGLVEDHLRLAELRREPRGDLGERRGARERRAGIVRRRRVRRHRPSFPGFMMPYGSQAALSAPRSAMPSLPCSRGMNAALSRPTPWWWLIDAPVSVTAVSADFQIWS